MFKIAESCFPFPAPVSMLNFLLLLTIMDAGSDLHSIPPND